MDVPGYVMTPINGEKVHSESRTMSPEIEKDIRN
jgi:hypothetical protein